MKKLKQLLMGETVIGKARNLTPQQKGQYLDSKADQRKETETWPNVFGYAILKGTEKDVKQGKIK